MEVATEQSRQLCGFIPANVFSKAYCQWGPPTPWPRRRLTAASWPRRRLSPSARCDPSAFASSTQSGA
eukprot:3054251-Alexandrium_andersonii.AAC.1